MMYLAWAGFYEGSSDREYYELLLPRVMEAILQSARQRDVTVPEAPALRFRSGRERDAVAKEACSYADAFHLLFIHADTDGRGREATGDARGVAYCEAVRERCAWHPDRCMTIRPRHETEAWVLSDPRAVLAAFGVTGSPTSYGLPSDAVEAERLTDAKSVLDRADRHIRGRRARNGRTDLLVSIAQRQSIDALRGSRSFQSFEADLRRGLQSLGCL